MSLAKLQKLKAAGKKIAAITAYDATFAKVFVDAGCDLLLVGDSLGMVVQGRKNTLAVSIEDIAYHVGCCVTGAPDAFIVADMPFGSFETSPEAAFEAAHLLVVAGASMVKIEGGAEYAETVSYLVKRGIPVCAHVGLLPQASLMTGFRIQGTNSSSAARILADAKALSAAGARLMVIELIPAQLATKITASLKSTITIGIGAGNKCDGQILVMHDVLGIFANPPKFSKNYLADADSIADAVSDYVQEVKTGKFPAKQHTLG